MDVTGVFGYSDEDGTEAASYDRKLDDGEIRDRVEHVSGLVEELTSQRAEERLGETVEILVEGVSGALPVGRAALQGPEVDGTTTLEGAPPTVAVGDLVSAVVVASDGVDLVARPAGGDPS
jgi:tRNA A37 methylthiotransferase MiaB